MRQHEHQPKDDPESGNDLLHRAASLWWITGNPFLCDATPRTTWRRRMYQGPSSARRRSASRQGVVAALQLGQLLKWPDGLLASEGELVGRHDRHLAWVGLPLPSRSRPCRPGRAVRPTGRRANCSLLFGGSVMARAPDDPFGHGSDWRVGAAGLAAQHRESLVDADGSEAASQRRRPPTLRSQRRRTPRLRRPPPRQSLSVRANSGGHRCRVDRLGHGHSPPSADSLPAGYGRAVAPRTSTATLGSGLTLSYSEQGEGARQALVLLPGPTDSWLSYEPVLARLP